MHKSEYAALRPLKDLNVIDNFLFGELCTDTPAGRRFVQIILETVLNRKISIDKVIFERTLQGIETDRHGIRMDAYIHGRTKYEETGEEAERVTIYDLEPDNNSSDKAELPRRNRYYAALRDVKELERGADYAELPDMVSIFLMSYDPFGQGAMYYEARTVLTTHPEETYDDGLLRIFLYVRGDPNKGEKPCSKGLANLLHFVGDSTDVNVLDETTKELDRLIKGIKSEERVSRKYMKYEDYWKGLKRQFKAEGELIDQIRLVKKKIARGKELSQIAEEMEEDESALTPLYEAVISAGNDADPELIMEKLLENAED